jgi:hypothetical protein
MAFRWPATLTTKAIKVMVAQPAFELVHSVTMEYVLDGCGWFGCGTLTVIVNC